MGEVLQRPAMPLPIQDDGIEQHEANHTTALILVRAVRGHNVQ
jgi:hypothetical protein